MERNSVLDIYYHHFEQKQDRVAVTDLFDELTYAELETQSNRLCAWLCRCGVTANSLVPICMENGVDRIVAVLAILKCGAAYVLISPGDWESKHTVVAEHTDGFVIAETENRFMFDGNWKLITLEQSSAMSGEAAYVRSSTENSLFCAHFTSGSTGTPKLALVQHFDVYDTICAKDELMVAYGVQNVVQFLSPYFAFGMEVYSAAIMTGRTLFLMDDIGRGNLPAVFKFMKNNDIHMAELPASLVNTVSQNAELLELLPDSLRVINTAGENLYLAAALEAVLRRKEIDLYCEYGCSEMLAVFLSNVRDLGRNAEGQVCLGTPINGCVCFTDNGHLLVARSGKSVWDYDARRIKNLNLMADPGRQEAVFDTMDMIDMQDGDVYIVGRANRCEKIRGYRVNLSEIEYCVRSGFPQIDLFVGVAETKEHVKKIGVVYAAAEDVTPEAIQEIAAQKLEEYKRPQIIIRTDALPKNRNGKKDICLCTEMLNRQLRTRYSRETMGDIRAAVRQAVARYVGVLKEADMKKTFRQLDVDSLTLITILCEIEEASGVPIELENLDTEWVDTPEKLENYILTVSR